MDLYEVFDHPFKLTSRRKEYNLNYKSEYYRFKTNEIRGETSKQEVFILAKLYFDNFVEKFKHYTIESIAIVESSFRLYVEIIEEDELNEKHIYSMSYNNIKNKISFENKYNEDFSIEGIFRICLNIACYVYEDEDIEEDEEHTVVKKSIKEDECVICFENKPNILFVECLHICVCKQCDKKGNFNKCPLCRKKINNQKILFS